MVYQNAKLELMQKFLKNQQFCRKQKQDNEAMQCPSETKFSTLLVTKQSEEHGSLALTVSRHDFSSNNKITFCLNL